MSCVIKPFSHKVSLGQNFLINKEVIRRSAQAGNLTPQDVVLEIGPGQGVLTEQLLASPCAYLHALEIDRRLEPWLLPLQEAHKNRLAITWGDALEVPFESLTPRPNKILANIPYNITTPLIRKILKELAPLGLELIILLIQKEAADRLTSPPGRKERYPLGVTLELMGDLSTIMKVSPGSFNPPPKVTSSLVLFQVQRNRHLADDDRWAKLLQSAFAQRRKTLLNNLTAAGYPKAPLAEALSDLAIAPNSRAEELTGDQWLELYERLLVSQSQSEPTDNRV